jgi:glutamate-1-semialdehyde 2,1-aminomutase
MVELAEFLVDMTEGMSWAFFAKNGADTTNYAVMIARDATGRNKIVAFDGCYHGTSPWMQGMGHHGVIEDDTKYVLKAKWNDYADFERVVRENKGQIAALIASPYLVPTFRDNGLPAEGFWENVDALCKREGIILISDDIRHGFRMDLRGSHVKYGYKPDLVCYCKAIANGYPISACLGTGDMKQFASRVFHTGSYWYQSEPMAAALATLKEHKRINTPKVCTEKGEKLLAGLVDVAAGYGYELKTSGDPAMPYLRTTNDPSLMLHQDWCAESTKRGAFFTSHHNWFISTAHTDADIKKTLQIADEAFKVIKKKYGDEF